MHNIVLIGRTNVGKSTLFNRLIGKRKAIVHDTPGTTRDRNEFAVNWKGKNFTVIDTGGWATDDEIFSASVRKQLDFALEKASLALLVVDAKAGYHPLDNELAKLLRKAGKKVIVVVNKIDTAKDEPKAAEFYRLGLDEMVTISANHGLNIYELLDDIVAYISTLPEQVEPVRTRPLIGMILVGKPNVGKSSLLNTLLKEERSIVHDIPGTTRDAVDATLFCGEQEFLVIDTPGLHRKHKFKNDLEYLAALSTHHAMERADVAVLVIDATLGVGETETKIVELILQNHRSCIVAINKWDLIEDREMEVKRLERQFAMRLPFLKWADILFISAKTGQRTERLLAEVTKVFEQYSKTVDEAELRDTIRHAEFRKPFSRMGKLLHIREVKQVDIRPPTFVFTVNDPLMVHFSYRRFLENNIRERFGFQGTPIVLKFQRVQKGK